MACATFPPLAPEILQRLPEVIRDVVRTDRQMQDLLAPRVIRIDRHFRERFRSLRTRRAENITSARAVYAPKADA